MISCDDDLLVRSLLLQFIPRERVNCYHVVLTAEKIVRFDKLVLLKSFGMFTTAGKRVLTIEAYSEELR